MSFIVHLFIPDEYSYLFLLALPMVMVATVGTLKPARDESQAAAAEQASAM